MDVYERLNKLVDRFASVGQFSHGFTWNVYYSCCGFQVQLITFKSLVAATEKKNSITFFSPYNLVFIGVFISLFYVIFMKLFKFISPYRFSSLYLLGYKMQVNSV